MRVNHDLVRAHQRIGREFFVEHTSVYELFSAQAKKFSKERFKKEILELVKNHYGKS